MSVAKAKEDLLEFDINLAAKVESHELAGGTSINSKENALKHRTKISKETLNWSQRSVTILFYLHPFFGDKSASLVCYTYGVKKRDIERLDIKPQLHVKVATIC